MSRLIAAAVVLAVFAFVFGVAWSSRWEEAQAKAKLDHATAELDHTIQQLRLGPPYDEYPEYEPPTGVGPWLSTRPWAVAATTFVGVIALGRVMRLDELLDEVEWMRWPSEDVDTTKQVAALRVATLVSHGNSSPRKLSHAWSFHNARTPCSALGRLPEPTHHSLAGMIASAVRGSAGTSGNCRVTMGTSSRMEGIAMTMRYRGVVCSAIVLVILTGLVAFGSTSPTAGAQDESEERLSALETQVAVQATQLADLTARVEVLEASGSIDGTPSASAETHTITGDLLLRQPLPGVMQDLGPCLGIKGYDDIYGGQTVVVRDGSGTILAVGELGPGEWVEADTPAIDQLDFNCRFPISVEAVPSADFYLIVIGGGRRGALTYSFTELDAANWEIHITLGDNST
jgi:hypothetical protein